MFTFPLIVIPIVALSVANIEMSSSYYSSMLICSTVASLDLLYHIVLLTVALFVHRKDFSSASEHHTVEGAKDKKSDSDYFDMPPLKPGPPSSIAFSEWNIKSLIFLIAINFIAFSIVAHGTATVSSTMGGKPVEPESLKLQKMDFQIQATLTVFFGCELLTIAITLGLSALGRRRILLEEETRLRRREARAQI